MDDNQTWMKSEMGWDLKEPIYNIHLKTKKKHIWGKIRKSGQNLKCDSQTRRDGVKPKQNLRRWRKKNPLNIWEHKRFFFFFGKVIFANWNP